MPISLSLRILAVGKFKDKVLEQKFLEYSKKIEFDARFTVHEIKDSSIETEGEKLGLVLQKNSGYTFALTEFGKEYTSTQFAKKLESLNAPINFVIGGHHGLCSKILSSANEQFSLSKMTFTHEWARLILAEQLYRALSIVNNRNYHRE